MKKRLLCGLVLMTVSLWAQRQMTVAQLVTFIRSSIQLHQDDKQVADFVKSIKLTNRLDERTVEDLQGMGLGPRTLSALKLLVTGSTTLAPPPPPAPKPVVVLPAPPDSIEQKRVLAEVTENALSYSKNLPNFLCTQVTRRHVDNSGMETYSLMDTIQERLSYADHKEEYQVTLINNRPVQNVSHQQLGGATSSGEFGSILSEIFAPDTETQFEWERWATIRGRRMHVFNFRVRQDHSKYTIFHQGAGRQITAGYHGLIYADAKTHVVMRVRLECDTIPYDFPIQQVSMDLNYDFTKISDQEYLLPLKAELKSREGKLLVWNEVDFRLYRKFGSEATISFEPIDLIPDDQIKEQGEAPLSPATKAPAKK